MTDHQKLEEIISLLTFLQIHIQNNVNQSFTDLTFNLEIVLRDFLNVFEGNNDQYENVNYLKNNFPAIDLVNKNTGTVVQITTNADARKVRKTIETAQKHNLKFSKLIIIGFVSLTKPMISGAKVYGVNYLIELVKFGTNDQKDKIYQILKRQIPLNVLNPLSDQHSIGVVLDVIDRSAVRDCTSCEGDFDRMVKGLFEIKEIITTGEIKGKPIRAKSLVEYTYPIKMSLSEIEFLISKIVQMCNANKNKRQNSFLYLSRQEMEVIDSIKEQIIEKSNAIAQAVELGKRIVGGRQ